MEIYTIEDRKMMNAAVYAINLCGVSEGCDHYNVAISDYTTAKKKTLEQLKAEIVVLHAAF